MRFHDRKQAGELLAQRLLELESIDSILEQTIVLGLPRGGVPLAKVIADRLHCPLDVLLVRKLGLPQFPELAMGAIASDGVRVLNKAVVNAYHVTEREISRVESNERKELIRREQSYRGNSSFPKLADKTVIIVDDGIATGATVKAAIEVVRHFQPNKIILAVPVAPVDVFYELADKVDELICLIKADDFQAVGQFYETFPQVDDNEVKCCLADFS